MSTTASQSGLGLNRKHLSIIAVVVVPVLIGLVVLGWMIISEAWLQMTLLPKVESRYGGEIIGNVHQVGSSYEERLTIWNITPGSAFDAAGISHNDVVLTNDSIAKFAQRLDVPAGTQITLTVVSGGNGPPFNRRQSSTVVVTAP